jgi:hypothetical protein
MLIINYFIVYLLKFQCREAKRTLPRPKVGDFCSNAMEQGFSDACVALCMDERPVPRVAQTCRAAAIEMPRPTVRRWCEHGYNVAYQKTVTDLKTHFKSDAKPVPPVQAAPVKAEKQRVPEPEPEPVRQAEPEVPAAAAVAAEEQRQQQQQQGSGLRGGSGSASSDRAITAKIPITIEDVTRDLLVYEGQNAEEAVVVFCREYVPDDVSSCIRQLVSTVIEKLEEGNTGM